MNDQITSIKKQIKKYESDSSSEDEFCNVKYNENEENENENKDDSLNKDEIKRLTEERMELEKVLSQLCNSQNIDELRLKIKAKTRQFVINERLDKLKNNYVMDKTPLGNVLMLYNNKRGSFEFYSDNTIPYRYLEPVSRKYVKMFDNLPSYE